MNRLFVIILSVLLTLPITVWAVDETDVNDVLLPVNQIEEELPSPESVETTESIDYKEPISKRKIFKKFFAAMSGVIISSLLIYLMLTVYNKFRENFLNTVKTPEGETSLETPDDVESAVRTFLDKTKW